MYIHGGVILSALALVFGLFTVGSLEGAIYVWWDFYMTRVLPWPVDEILTADGFFDLFFSHMITIGVGLLSATSKWWVRV